MRTRTIVIGTLLTVGIAGWIILDADPDGRAELWNCVTTAFGAEEEPTTVPNWGDVATRIGEFTEEERALRAVLNPASPEPEAAAVTPPDPAAAEPGPAAGAKP